MSFLAGFLVYVISTVSNVIMWYQVQTIEWHLGAGRTEIMTRWQQIILFRNQYAAGVAATRLQGRRQRRGQHARMDARFQNI